MTQVEKEVDAIENINVQMKSVQESVRGVKISVRFKYLEANRSTPDTRFTFIHYPISIYLGEAVGSHRGNATVPFTLKANTNPSIAEFSVKGEAYISGSPEEIESWVIPNGDKAPKIWTRIYQESVAMLTILARFIDIPPPPVSQKGERSKLDEQ